MPCTTNSNENLLQSYNENNNWQKHERQKGKDMASGSKSRIIRGIRFKLHSVS